MTRAPDLISRGYSLLQRQILLRLEIPERNTARESNLVLPNGLICFLTAAFCRLAKSLSHSEEMG